MAWSAEQVSALQAMGLSPYVLAGSGSPTPVAEPAATSDRLALALLRARG